MGIVFLDPTLFAEEILTHYVEMPGEIVSLTGLPELDTITIYGTVLNTLTVDNYRYGHMIDNNTVAFSCEDVSSYLDDLSILLMEATGVEEVELEIVSGSNSLDNEYNAITGQYTDDTPEEGFASEEILGEYLAECFERSIKVVTGKLSDISTNKFSI